MHNLAIYGIVFTVAGGLAATGAYLIAPSRTVSAIDSQDSSSETTHVTSVSSEDESSDTGFVPVTLTPRDYLIDNLSKMKTLSGEGNVSLSIDKYNINLDIKNIYLTLETLNDIEASVSATLDFNGQTTDIDVTYAGGTIYLTLLGTDIKLETSDFSKVFEMISSFGLPEIELPEELSSISLDSLQDKLGNMPYTKTENGYEYVFELIDGCPIVFYSDDNYNFTALKADNFKVAGINLNLNANVETKYELDKPVEIPETLNRQFANFSDLMPLIGHIGDLIQQKQFALNISGDIKAANETMGVTFAGETQFDIDTKTGKGLIDIVEHEYEKLYKHNVAIDVSKDDVVFNYNNGIKGRLAFASLNNIIECIQSLLGDFDVEIPTSIEGIVSLLEGTVLKAVLDGKYELLLNNIVKDIVISNGYVSLTIDKSLLGLSGDLNVEINFNESRLLGVTINNICVLNRTINIKVELGEYNESFDVGINRNEINTYGDYANLVPLVKGIKSLVEQKQFALSLNGSLRKNNEVKGLTFEGSTQFDLDEKTGDGEVTITENESTYSTKPKHKIKIGVDNQDVRFNYNDKLNGRFSIQTILDIFDIVVDLVKSEDSRIYQWFGEMIENMSSTVLMRVINGEYTLLFHNIIKKLDVNSNSLDVTISGDIVGIDSDLTINVGFNNQQITGVSIVDFKVLDYTINLNVNVTSWNENYSKLPTVDQVSYYDFSDIKTLAELGLNVANLDYFHITGTANLNMNVIGISLDGLANLKDMPVEINIYENNGNVCIKGTISDIPTVGIINGIDARDDHFKSLDFYYDNGFMYLTRHDYTADYFIVRIGNYYEVTDSIKTTTEDFTAHILDYLLGWGMGLNRSPLVWNAINNAISEHAERTKAMDYASLLTNYAYTPSSNSTYGNYRWDIGLNIAELANNTDMKSCNATIFGRDMTFTNPDTSEKEIKRYLSHLDANLGIEAGGVFSLNISASLDLVDIDPYLTYKDFLTNSLTKDGFTSFKSYIASHQSDLPLSF